MKMKIAVAVSCVALLATVFGFAQAVKSIRVNIPFQFVVEGKTLPTGEYNLVRSEDERTIEVVSTKKGPSTYALVITRLGGEIHTTPQDSHIVFDNVGNTYFLSEIWIPGMDGFLVHATKEKHEHRTISVPK